MKRIIVLLTLSLIGVNIWSLINTKKLKDENAILREYIEEVTSNSTKIEMLKMDQLNTFQSEGVEIADSILVSDENGITCSLNEIVAGKMKFIFRYSDINCQTCVDVMLPHIKNLTDCIGSENVIFLASYKNSRDLFAFKRIHELKNNIYDAKLLNIHMENCNAPYCFVIENNITKFMFVPRKEIPAQAEYFFNFIKKIFSPI